MAKFSLRVANFAGTLTVDESGRLQAEASSGYALRESDGFSSITCLACGTTSYNPNDVAHRYCGRCGKYHDA